MALTKAVKSGEGERGRDLNSGCAWVAIKKSFFSPSTNSTRLPSGDVPEILKPPCSIFSLKVRFTS